MVTGDILNEGKTKIIRDAPDEPGCVVIESKDDITAGDGAQRDELEGKAVAATSTTCNVFHLLNKQGIPTHYRERLGTKSFLASKVEMIPLELVARRVATGSYLKRNPAAVEGEVFEDLVFEVFHKDDPNHDPIVIFGDDGEATRYPASQPEDDREPIDTMTCVELGLGHWSEDALATLEELTRRTFETLESALAEQDIQLVDMKIECGWVNDEIVVADVIDNDSWRIWPSGDKTQMLDKQVYRNLAGVDDPKAKAKELGKIKENYEEVARKTGKFV